MLMKFHLFVSGCFSYDLAPEYQRYYKEFKISVWELISTNKGELGLTLFVPWKLYMVVSHIQSQLDISVEG